MTTRIGIGRIGLAIAAALCGTPVSAQVDIETVAVKKEYSPEAGFWYVRFKRPAVGDSPVRPVTFFAKTRGTTSSKKGIFTDDPKGPGSTVALVNQASPTGQAFRLFGNPAMNSSGDLTFHARLVGGGRGVFRKGPRIVALLGDSVPGVTGLLDRFSDAVMTDDGDVVFRATLSAAADVGGVKINEGVFRCRGGDGNCSSGTGTLQALVLRNAPVPDRPGRKLCRIWGARASNFGIAFLAETKEECGGDGGLVRKGIFRMPFGGPFVTLALEGEVSEPIPDLGGTTYGLIRTDPDIANDGSVAFRARTGGILFSQALFLCRAATCPAAAAEVAVIHGDVDPRGNVFRFLGEPVVSDTGDLAFKAIARGDAGRVTGVYVRRANGALQALALQGDLVPDIEPATEFRRMLAKAYSPLEMSTGGKIAFKAKVRRVNPPRVNLEGVFLVDFGAVPPTTTTTTVIGTTTTTTTAPPTTSTTTTVTTTTAPPTTTTTLDCDCSGMTRLSFLTAIPTEGETAGTLSNYRCSNAASSACTTNGDCDFGTCFVTPPFCSGNFSIACSDNTDCQGACAEVVSGNLPLGLTLGGLYTGGGLNSVPLPFPVPDRGLSYTGVSTVNGQTLTLSPTTPAEVGQRNCTQGRTCDNNPGQHCVLDADCGAGQCVDNCIFGPPLPISNANTPSTSVCTVNVVDRDASGTAECAGGESNMSTPLRSVIYLNGDLFKSSTPPDLPGVQPCPICVPVCQGGPNSGLPCRSDNPPVSTELSDCVNGGGTCPSATECMGGPDDGSPCTPATSDSIDLRDDQDSYPTSHDCGLDPLQNITANIGGLPVEFALTTSTVEWNAVDRPNGARVFCGFCRDVQGAGSLCFEGDTNPGCPVPGGGQSADGNANACDSDADCSDGDEYESCVQRDPGAFSEATATRIEVSGATDGQCLDDGASHPAALVSIFCIPPTFDATVDAAGDLPGPGAALLFGDVRLQ